MRIFAVCLFFYGVACLFSGSVQAKTWTVDPAQSHLRFIGSQGGEPFDGAFKNFQVTIDLDLAKPETGKIVATIDTTSATAGNKERDDYLPLSDWFDVKKYATAKFESQSLHAATAGCFEAVGSLTIKDVARPLTLPFCLKTEGDHTRATGRVTLVRTDYHLGLGEWSNENFVKYGVDVVVDVVAR